MSTKEQILAVVHNLSDDTSIDQVIDKLHFLKKVQRGIAEADREEGMDHEEFMNQLMEDEKKG